MAVLAAVLIAFSSPGLAAKGGIKGPPVGGETGNNLSLPSIQTESATVIEAYWRPPNDPQLGVHYSYGCDAPQSDGQFNYPNTSCVDNLSVPTVYYDVNACKANVPQCADIDVYRIYWQKVDVNEWWADDDGIGMGNAAEAAFVDWGDALEAVSWNERSVIRVETQPYSSMLIDDTETGDVYEASLLVDEEGHLQTCAEAASVQGLDPAAACKTGFQMWHVSGQGITEHWGVRANDADAVSFNYDSPFQIIKSTDARLNLAKMAPGDATCSMPGGNPGDDSPEVGTWTGSGWEGTCTWYDEKYSVETSVGGKYVYGYNWRMKDVSLAACGDGWIKTGFWRLTFYAPEDITFNIDEGIIGDEVLTNIVNRAPPAAAAEARVLVEDAPVFAITSTKPVVIASTESEDEDPDADDRLYRPVIDNDNDLTYIDICIVSKTKGGGGGGGGGKGGGGGSGGGAGTKGGGH
jgi:hypothetical protein